MRPVIFFLPALCLLAAPHWAIAQTHQQLPDGPGKVTTQRICGGCHAPEIVVGKHLTKDGWEQLIGTMVEKGATGTDDEFNQIIDYLAANFPKTKDTAKTNGN